MNSDLTALNWNYQNVAGELFYVQKCQTEINQFKDFDDQ